MDFKKPYDLHDIVVMKKPHPCASDADHFEIIRMGADIKIKCLKCQHVIMLERPAFERKYKKIIKKN